ncbi:MAG: hypothetical protein HUU21_20850 [Polyangiaceae bacterium]|nr:hypothetical protein [Polyangiaceae bacterium]
MIRPSIGFLVIASVLSLAGCADGTTPAPSPSSELAHAEESFSSSVGTIDPELIGTFRGEAVQIGELTLLALKTDGTFHYGMAILCASPPAPCGPADEDGFYKLVQRQKSRFIELYNMKGILRARFEYMLGGDTLRMRRTDTGGGQWRSMIRSEDAWCALPSDCGVQNLNEGTCAGAWDCVWGVCDYRCSLNACEVMGGRCQTKGGCSQGAVGDAHDYVCKDGGLECCVKLAEEPACMFQGSTQEGWYLSDGEERLCLAKCAGASLRCAGPSITSEGYYAVQGEGCDGSLVMRGRCSL